MNDTLVVAGLSARALAESAAQGGWRVVALDLFGDTDTRRASPHWLPIGDAASLAIDGPALCDALAAVARLPGVVGWVAGSGFEAAPEWLDAAPSSLPLLGMGSAAVRALREPHHFFATLTRLGFAHPPTLFDAPSDTAGWLVKRFGGSGGWHIRAAAHAGAPRADSYYQRELDGVPMSALFLADGRHARIVALNRLIVRPLGSHPHVYRGAIGPIHDPRLQDRVDTALAALVPAFGLRGLASLDFIAVGAVPHVLEINPRHSASMVLHAAALPAGLLRAHVDALRGALPAQARHPVGLRGTEILFASHRGSVSPAVAATLATLPYCHDLPAAGSAFNAGDPVCSVSAEGADADAVERGLRDRLAAIASLLAQRVTEPHAT